MIPSQLPSPVPIQTGLQQLLGLKPGQVLEALVTGQNAQGATEVLIGKQQMTLALQQALVPGTTLQMRVETTQTGSRFVIVAQTPPQDGQPEPTVLQPALPDAPAQSQAAVRTASQSPATSSQAPRTQSSPAAVSQPTSERVQEPATIIERQAGAPVRTATNQLLNLRSGETVEARVIGPAPAGNTQVAIGKQQVALPLPNAPVAGTVLQLRAEETPLGQRLVVVTQTPPQAGGQLAVTTPVQAQLTARPQVPAELGRAPVASPQQVSQTPVQAPSAGVAPAITRVAPILPAAQAGSSTMPQTEQAAVAQMAQTAAGQQDTTTGLMNSLVAVTRNRVPLPPLVQRAITLVLAARTDVSAANFDGEALRKAVLASGVFQEAQLADGDPATAGKGDVKSALMALRNALSSWLGDDGSAAVPPQTQPRSPPVRGGTPRAPKDTGDIATVSGPPEEIGKALLDRTDSALSRVRLHQHASLPDAAPRQAAEWHLELPVVINQQQHVMQFQIARDGGGSSGAQEQERSWQIRFAINLQRSGEVGAQVGLRGKRASVVLWAAEDITATQLRGLMPNLASELAGAGLEVGSISVRSGAPAATGQQPAAGNLVDAMR